MIDVFEVIEQALDKAIGMPDVEGMPRKINARRSQDFVEGLAEILREIYLSESSFAVFSKYHGGLKQTFGLHELLYDILVASTATTASARQGKTISFIARGIWAIESEMAKNSREAMYDFNKLVLSSCDKKLFVGPLVANVEDFLAPLAAAARNCSGELYLALIPHPREWNKKRFAPKVAVVKRLWSGSSWVPVDESRD